MPQVRSNTRSQACAQRKEISPAIGVPRARVAAEEAARDLNEVSQGSAQLVIQSADNWVNSVYRPSSLTVGNGTVSGLIPGKFLFFRLPC